MIRIALILLCLCSLMAQAQQIDKKWLPGEWMLYSMRYENITLYRDSMQRNVALVMRAEYPTESAKVQALYTSLFSEYFKTHLEFVGDTMTLESAFERGHGLFTGRYQWIGVDSIVFTPGQRSVMTYVVRELSADRLTIAPVDDGKVSRDLMTFVKE